MSTGTGSPPGLPSSGSARPTVVLACSGPEAGSIVEAARALIAHGVRVDVVAGVDLDSRPIELALEQHGEHTLWVLCRSEDLDEYQLELLLLTVRASEVPSEHVIALPYDPDATATFVALVRRRLAALQWVAPAPGVPSPRAVELTPVPTLSPEASHSAVIEGRSRTGRVLGALAILAAFMGLGARGWGTPNEVQASIVPASRIAKVEVDVATPAVPSHDEVRDRAPAKARSVPAFERATPVQTSTDVDAPGPAAEDPSSPLQVALAERRIRALDALLVATPERSVTARKARAQCRTLEVAGVHAWRLPEAAELGELVDAGFLPAKARYWTRRGKTARQATVTGGRVQTKRAGPKSEASLLCVAVAKA